MIFTRCHRIIFAAALLLAGLIVAPAAQAHAGHPGKQESRNLEQTKTDSVELHAVAGTFNPADPSSQCGAQMCCGSACFAGGHVMKGETLLLPPATSAAVVFPANSPPVSGIAQEGLRRPPRA